MLTISTPSPNRLDLELSGLIDAQEMDRALTQLIEQSKGVENGKMLYTIKGFELPTLGALAVELQHIPRLFGLLGKFRKCAVLSDTSWIRTFAEIEGALIPNLNIKSFTLSARDAAEAWLADGDAPFTEDADEAENFPV